MTSALPSVFISYRRDDCPGHAGRLFDHLRARFGAAKVFMDVTGIEAGVDFTEVLQRAVGSCDVLIAVIGREWLTCTDRNGRRRLDDPNDFIRLEIGIALTRHVRVIPVLVEGASIPSASELPPDLREVAKRQAVELRDARWNSDVDDLAHVLERVLAPLTANASSTSRPRPAPASAKMWALGAIALAVVLVAAVTLLPRTSLTSETSQSAPSAPAVAAPRAPVETQTAAPAPIVSPERGERADVTAPPTPAQRVSPERGKANLATPMVPPESVPRVVPERNVRPDTPTSEAPPSSRRNSGFLGVRMVNPVAESRGVVARGAIVQALTQGGPAANAGLMAGDLVVEYGGKPVEDAADFSRQVSASLPGDTVVIRLRRAGLGRSLEVVVGDRASAPGALGIVLVHYTAADEQKTAEDLAAALREAINEPRYAVRISRTAREVTEDGEVRYSATGLETLAGTLAQSAGLTLSKVYRRRVTFARVVDPRVTATTVMVVMPRRTLASQLAPPDPVITIAYASAADAGAAMSLADFLRTLRSGWKYSVRTKQMTERGTAGQIEYDTERLGSLAQVLAREPAAWISRAYGRQIVLQPTKSDKVGADAVVIWLPSR